MFVNSNPSLQPAFDSSGWGGPLGRPSILFDGAAHYLHCGSSLPTTLAGGTDTAFSLFWVAQQVSTAGIQNHLGFFRSTSTQPLEDFFTSGGLYRSNRRDDAGTLVPVTGGTPDTSRHIFEAIYSGTAITFRIDGGLVFNNVAQDVGAITFDSMVLGCTYANGSPDNFANLRLARLLGFTGAIGTTDADHVRSILTAMYM